MLRNQSKYFFGNAIQKKTKNQSDRILQLQQQYETLYGQQNLSQLFSEKFKFISQTLTEQIDFISTKKYFQTFNDRLKSPYDSKFTENMLISLFSIGNFNFKFERGRELAELKTIKVISPRSFIFLTSAPRAYMIKGYYQNCIVLNEAYNKYHQPVFGFVTNLQNSFILSYDGQNLNIESSLNNLHKEKKMIDSDKINISLNQIYNLLL